MRRVMTILVLLLAACTDRATGDAGSEGEGASDDFTTMSSAMTTSVDDTSVAITTGDSRELSHAIHVQPIFDEHCVTSCHEPGGEWGLLDLSPGASYDATVGAPSLQLQALALIEPGQPEQSYLWHKLNDTQAIIGGGGLDMPKSRFDMGPTVLTPEQLTTIEQWILQGAPP